MSVLFGRWNFDDQPEKPEFIEKVSARLAPYAPDGKGLYSDRGVTILYHAFHTTRESRSETQPHVSKSGAVITWDGRLDNRAELIGELGNGISSASTDLEIVGAAYDKWGNKCLPKFHGDWALSIWDPKRRSVLLAKDPIGVRHLHYLIEKNKVTWCTTIDPLVLFAERTFQPCEEYIAGWFSTYPDVHLTLYDGVHSVPPSSYVLVRQGNHTVTRHWDFDPGKSIRYRLDAEYEEHFRTVFSNAVRNRLRADSPILAELSGGRDSSSIVCMADAIIARGQAECPRLDTVSYFDDSEPNWNERPYFTKVEEKRGRKGWHIGPQNPEEKSGSEAAPDANFAPAPNYPGYDGRTSPQMRTCLTSQGNRVLLSGIGGDEVMGGVPTPAPELADLLARAKFGMLAHQLKVWALEKRVPWFHIFWEAVREFLPSVFLGVAKSRRPVPWLCASFVKRNSEPLHHYSRRAKLFGPLPSFQGNVYTLDGMRRQLTQAALPFAPPCEKRYPFLDRGLLEFLFAVPREQLLRPQERRSLMRRALAGIVPEEILNRKAKGFVARAPMVTVARDWSKLFEMTQNMVCGSLGIVDPERFAEALQTARRGEEVPMYILMRTLLIEGWIRQLRTSGIVNLPAPQNSKLTWQASKASIGPNQS